MIPAVASSHPSARRSVTVFHRVRIAIEGDLAVDNARRLLSRTGARIPRCSTFPSWDADLQPFFLPRDLTPEILEGGTSLTLSSDSPVEPAEGLLFRVLERFFQYARTLLRLLLISTIRQRRTV